MNGSESGRLAPRGGRGEKKKEGSGQRGDGRRECFVAGDKKYSYPKGGGKTTVPRHSQAAELEGGRSCPARAEQRGDGRSVEDDSCAQIRR